MAENININAQNTPEYKVGGRPGRADTEHVVVAVDFTQQRSLLAAVDNVQRTMGQRLRVLPVNKMVAKNCDILLLNTKLRTISCICHHDFYQQHHHYYNLNLSKQIPTA